MIYRYFVVVNGLWTSSGPLPYTADSGPIIDLCFCIGRHSRHTHNHTQKRKADNIGMMLERSRSWCSWLVMRAFVSRACSRPFFRSGLLLYLLLAVGVVWLSSLRLEMSTLYSIEHTCISAVKNSCTACLLYTSNLLVQVHTHT